VLAIAAARLGFGPVLGLDHERESVEAALENAAANRVSVEVRRLDLLSEALPSMAAEDARSRPIVVTANLLRPLLLELAKTMPRAPAHLLAGGLLADEVAEVTSAFERRLGLRRRAERQSAGWAAVWLSAA